MASLYLFLDNRRPTKDGYAILRVAFSYRQQTVYHSLDIRLKPDEWDAAKNQVLNRPDKKFLNIEIRKRYADMIASLSRVERRKDFGSLTPREAMDMIVRGSGCVDEPGELDYVIPVYNEYITLCRKTSTAQVYKYSLKNLTEYCDDIDSLRFKDINGAWLRRYQNWLLDVRKMEVNGANVYLRNLRTIFNYALQNQFTNARYPFRDIDMSTTEPDKRTIPYEDFLKWVTIPMPDAREFYRDIFMLSFYLCGMRPIDLLNVKKSQVQEGRLVYKPEKLNGRTTLSIKIEPEAWDIIRKYEGKEYLLNIMDKRKDYKEFCKHWNAAIRAIGEDSVMEKTGKNGKRYYLPKHNGIIPHLTVYCARSCWATYMYNILDAPMDVISQGLGHKNGLRVTNFYVKRDTRRVDEANRQMIDRLNGDIAKLKGATA